MTILWLLVWVASGLAGLKAVRNDFALTGIPRYMSMFWVFGAVLFFAAVLISFLRTGTPHRLFFEEQEHLEW